MKRLIRTLVVIVLLSVLASCAVGTSPQVPASTQSALATMDVTPSTAHSTVEPPRTKLVQTFPECSGMQKLQGAVQFDWPTLAEHLQDFSRSQWTYYSCDQSASNVASLYRQDLPRPPYGMEETNWLERQEGTLGIFFSQKGAWDYIWFVPQPDDAQKSYVIISETFAYVECF